MTWSIHPLFNNNSLSNITYMVEIGEKEYLCIDPFKGDSVVSWLEQRQGRLSIVLNTHEHWDHISGNEELKHHYRCEIWAHEKAAEKISSVDRMLVEGEVLFTSGKNKLSILHTPGHSPGHLCMLHYVEEQVRSVFTGDTIFNGGVGNCKNGGDPSVLFSTVQKILKMIGPQTLIYPGHDYFANNLAFGRSILPTLTCSSEEQFKTLAQEQEYNLFFRASDREVKMATATTQQDEKETFLELRRRRDRW